MILSRHAQQRWKERFPSLDPEYEWKWSGKLGGGLKGRVKQMCPRHARLMKGFNGFYYTISPHRVIFVCAPPDFVVTVFRLPEHEKTPVRGRFYEQQGAANE